MANVFRCPACKNVISADADEGSDVRCPVCEETIPVLPSSADASALAPPPSSSGMAIGSIVCSILALVTCLVPLGIVGMILGIKALNLARVHPRRYDGAPLARAGFIIGGLSVITGMIAIPSTWHWFNNRQKEMSRRSVCMANLRCLGSAFYIYALDSPSTFPMTADVRMQNDGAFTAFSPRMRSNPPRPDDLPSPTVDMWMVIRANDCVPKQFVCPSTKDIEDPAQDTTLYYDFLAPENLSYAYLYQHDPDRKPIGISSESWFPVLADANPYVKGGVTTGFAADRASRSRGNSFNHGRDGQNVLYQDSHVNFEQTPDVGPWLGPTPANWWKARIRGDNIYTTHKPGGSFDPGDAAPTLVGTRGTCNLGSKSDACLIP